MTTSTDRTRFAQALRDLADVLDTNPDVPLPYEGTGSNALTFFIHHDISQALALHTVMTRPVLHRDRNDVTFPATLKGTLCGIPVNVHISSEIALAVKPTTVVLPQLVPCLADLAQVPS